MAVRDHITRVPKLRAKIHTVHPTERIIEVVTTDGAARRLFISDITPSFTWPVEGEEWSIYEENGYWILGNKFLDPDESTRFESLSPGDSWGTIDYVRLDSPEFAAKVDLTSPEFTAKENKAEKGVANGYAPLDSSSKVPLANLMDPQRVLLTKTGTQPLNNVTITSVNWDAKNDEVGTVMWTVGTPDLITIPVTGLYIIEVGLYLANTTGDHDVWLAQWGNSGLRFSESNIPGSGAYVNLAVVRSFPAGYQLAIYAFQTSGGATTMGTASTQAAHFQIARLS